MRRKIVMVLNLPSSDYMGGGNVRERALALWAETRDAKMIIIQDESYRSSRLNRLLALPRLLSKLWREPNSIVLLGYPGFPFFWSLDSIPQLMRAFLFIFGCKFVSVVRRQKIVIDIMDLPRYQYIDLGYQVGLPMWLFGLFDRCVYHLATELWVCSAGIAKKIAGEMLWGKNRVVVVENGAFPSDYDSSAGPMHRTPRIFIYAGQLYPARGVPELIDQFLRCRRTDIELRLCGTGGEWIPKSVTDPRIRYLGQLSEEECARAVAESDVGIVYQPRGPYYDIVYPTKMPLYVARGKPVLATDNPELARAVAEKQIGVVVATNGISDAVDSMSSDTLRPYVESALRLQRDVYWNSIYNAAFQNLSEVN